MLHDMVVTLCFENMEAWSSKVASSEQRLKFKKTLNTNSNLFILNNMLW